MDEPPAEYAWTFAYDADQIPALADLVDDLASHLAALNGRIKAFGDDLVPFMVGATTDAELALWRAWDTAGIPRRKYDARTMALTISITPNDPGALGPANHAIGRGMVALFGLLNELIDCGFGGDTLPRPDKVSTPPANAVEQLAWIAGELRRAVPTPAAAPAPAQPAPDHETPIGDANLPDKLIRFMRGRERAGYEEVAMEVHGAMVGESTIRGNMTRANQILEFEGSPRLLRCKSGGISWKNR